MLKYRKAAIEKSKARSKNWISFIWNDYFDLNDNLFDFRSIFRNWKFNN